MANQEHLDILKQGVETWNNWREEHPDIQPDLSGVDLWEATLSGADLSETILIEATLTRADLHEAGLSGADLSGTDLSGADLTRAHLTLANLSGANLTRAHLSEAILNDANLSSTDLSGADLSYTDLTEANLMLANLRNANLMLANLRYANLSGADLSGAILKEADTGWTIFANVDLSAVKELETITHGSGPSTIGIDTIIRSHGKIPEIFLRKAGVPQSIIEQIPALISSLKPIEYYSCFISYSSKDDAFARRLHGDLQSHNVRCWFAPEDMKIGDKIRPRIDESIRSYDKLLLVLSEHSVASKWVEFEVEAAMDKEQEGKPPVLFPVRVDDTVMESTTAWAIHIKRTRHIGDFTHWKNHDDFQKAFNRLIRDLKAEAPGRL